MKKHHPKGALIKSLLILSFLLPSFSSATTPAIHLHEGTKHATDQQEKQKNPIGFTIIKTVDLGNKKQVFFKLYNTLDNKPVTLQDLKLIHTQKIHLLIIDDSLEDYSHVHAVKTKEAGVYQFSWQPKLTNSNYTIWANIVTNASNQQEYLLAPLVKNSQQSPVINRKPFQKSKLEGFSFQLSFNQPKLIVGEAVVGTIHIQNAKGEPVTDLEPVMGAYAHIVGFGEDLKTVVHIHPMGKEPSSPSDRGGPILQFHLQAEKAGFIKLFAQIKINNKELFVPFGLLIEKA